MWFPKAWPVLACALAIGAGPPPGSSPYPSLSCYLLAIDHEGLISSQAKQLCIGAPSIAPVQCYAVASNRLALADVDAIRLCVLARSVEPARCVARLQRTTSYDQATMVEYCAASRYALAPPPEPGSADCLQVAQATTLLADADTIRLCQGSASALPADCFAWGRKHTLLTDADLIDLCAPVVPYAVPFGGAVPGVPSY